MFSSSNWVSVFLPEKSVLLGRSELTRGNALDFLRSDPENGISKGAPAFTNSGSGRTIRNQLCLAS
jgi:hypothetical protein